MTPEELVRQIQDQYQEWFEMTDNSRDLLVSILASKLLGIMQYTAHLEKKLKYV